MGSKNKFTLIKSLAIAIVAFGLIFGFASREKDGSGKSDESQRLNKIAGAYVMKINNIIMPMNSSGVIADVLVPPDRAGGLFDGHGFLYSGGFFVSGYRGNFLWANGVATASRVNDYQAGPVGTLPSDPLNKMYIVRSDEEPFGQGWQDWIKAVSLGADYYNGDGIAGYNPTDRNGNGAWDPDEDRPDLLGDETVWTVFNDGVSSGIRRFSDVTPVGLEIHQTVFGFASSGLLGNMLFVRYKLINKGTERLDTVYFGVWADPDVGDYTNDLVGCDTTRNAGYVYQAVPDGEYGPNPPAFLIDFFQGPIFRTGNSSDTAYNIKGPYLGVDTIVGAKNLRLSSFVHYVQSHPTHGDPGTRFEARNYMLGLNRIGQKLDPCIWTLGTVMGGVNCALVDPRFSYSGNPVTKVGWINNTGDDQRQMQNTGPFTLRPKTDTIIVVAALIIARGSSPLTSVDEAKRISDFAQFIYDGNFKTAPPPPTVKPIVRTTENTIDLIWKTADQVNWTTKTVAYDQRFEGYELWAFRTNNTTADIGGIENAKIIGRWDMKNNFENILVENGQTGEKTMAHLKGTQLDPVIYSDKEKGVIKYSLTVDPFTTGPIIKGKPYFLAIVGYGVNYDALKPVNPAKPVGNYYIDGGAFVGITANVKKIIDNGIVPGKDFNDPYSLDVKVPRTAGNTEATASFEEIDKTKLTADTYEVSFFRNSDSTTYFMNWRLVNTRTKDTLVKSSNSYNNILSDADKYTIPIVDGVIPRINWVPAKVDTAKRSSSLTWARKFTPEISGVFYMGADIPADAIKPLGSVGGRKSTITTADQLAQFEIVFKPGKAYRYISNSLGTAYLSAGSNLTIAGGAYFVDVPFQAWMKDTKLGINKQLAVGFTERLGAAAKADGQWNPDTSISTSLEYIIVFNSAYEAAPDTVKNPYIGYIPAIGTKTWANLNGWTPSAAAGFTEAQTTVAKSSWFNAIYVVGFEKKTSADTWSAADVLTVPISYPITTKDKFSYTTTKAGQTLSAADKKNLFDKVNVFPNPLYAYNPAGSYYANPNNPKNDEPYVTFSNLPEKVTIKLYSLSGQLLRTLTESDKGAGVTSPFLNWDIKNEDGLRAASGMYLAVVSSPGLGDKILKFAIIQPQKQIRRF